MTKINIKLLKEVLLFTIGIMLCTYIVYIRFILKRIPESVLGDWNPFLFILYLGLYITLLRNHIKPPLYRSYISKLLFTRLVQPIVSLFKTSLAFVYEKIITEKRIINIRPILHKIILNLGENLHNHIEDIPRLTFANLHIALVLLPRLITLVALAVDVIILHEFFYFYHLIFLLSIPLIWNIFLYFLKKEIETHMRWYDFFMTTEIQEGPPCQIICTPRTDTIITKVYHLVDKDYHTLTHEIRNYLTTKLFFIQRFESDSIIFRTKRIYRLTTIIYLGYITVLSHLVIIQLVSAMFPAP